MKYRIMFDPERHTNPYFVETKGWFFWRGWRSRHSDYAGDSFFSLNYYGSWSSAEIAFNNWYRATHKVVRKPFVVLKGDTGD